MNIGRKKKIQVDESLDHDGELEIQIVGSIGDSDAYEWLTKQDAEVLIELLKNTFGI